MAEAKRGHHHQAGTCMPDREGYLNMHEMTLPGVSAHN